MQLRGEIFCYCRKRSAPYGYELVNRIRDGSKTYYLYQNKYALPFGFVYHEYLPEEDYER
jgi:hypothetical protein